MECVEIDILGGFDSNHSFTADGVSSLFLLRCISLPALPVPKDGDMQIS